MSLRLFKSLQCLFNYSILEDGLIERRKARSEWATAIRRLRELENLGHALVFIHGARTVGRKPS
jgi:hypothetical protein